MLKETDKKDVSYFIYFESLKECEENEYSYELGIYRKENNQFQSIEEVLAQSDSTSGIFLDTYMDEVRIELVENTELK